MKAIENKKKTRRLIICIFIIIAILLLFRFVVKRRMQYVPPNAPVRNQQIGKHIIFFEPEAVWILAFSEDSKYLYIIKRRGDNKENILFKWDVENNHIVYSGRVPNLDNWWVLGCDVLDNEMIIAVKEPDFYGKNYLFALDLSTYSKMRQYHVYGNDIDLRDGKRTRDVHLIYGVKFLDRDQVIFTYGGSGTIGQEYAWGTYIINRGFQNINPTKKHLNLDSYSFYGHDVYEIRKSNPNRKIQIRLKSPCITIYNGENKKEINDAYEYEINSAAICETKDYFAVVSSPIDMKMFPITYHYLVHPVMNYTTVALYRYSTGERVFCESYPNYPSYVCKISPDDKWLAVTVGGYVYVYDIDEISGEKKKN